MKYAFPTLFLVAALLFFQKMNAQSAGLRAEYFNGKNFETLVLERTDAAIDFDWPADRGPSPKLDATKFSARWTGQLQAPKSGEYTFFAKVDDGIRVWIGGKLVIDRWDLHDSEDFMGTMRLEAGKFYDLKVEFFNALLESEIHLKWQLPGDEPTFGGAFGYNEKVIGAKYFFQPKTASAPVLPPKTAQKVEKTKPIAPKPPKVDADTLAHFTPKNILFELSKSVMLAGSLAELDSLAGMMKRHAGLKLLVEGHTDAVGDAAQNLKLSAERAQAVADYLIAKGIQAERIRTQGFGSSKPLFVGSDSRNRRVEFKFE